MKRFFPNDTFFEITYLLTVFFSKRHIFGLTYLWNGWFRTDTFSKWRIFRTYRDLFFDVLDFKLTFFWNGPFSNRPIWIIIDVEVTVFRTRLLSKWLILKWFILRSERFSKSPFIEVTYFEKWTFEEPPLLKWLWLNHTDRKFGSKIAR